MIDSSTLRFNQPTGTLRNEGQFPNYAVVASLSDDVFPLLLSPLPTSSATSSMTFPAQTPLSPPRRSATCSQILFPAPTPLLPCTLLLSLNVASQHNERNDETKLLLIGIVVNPFDRSAFFCAASPRQMDPHSCLGYS